MTSGRKFYQYGQAGEVLKALIYNGCRQFYKIGVR